MAAVQAMTGGGGWPMSRVPDARRPAVLRRHVLPGRAAPRDAVVPPGARGRRPGVARAARRGRGAGRAAGRGARRAEPASRPAADGPTPRSCSTPRRPAIEASFDARNGGWGGAPKFPQPMTIEYLLRRHVATGDAAAAARSRGGRSTRWPTAGSTTSSAAASTATRPTPTGSCRTSSRCSTTTPSSRGSTSTPGR